MEFNLALAVALIILGGITMVIGIIRTNHLLKLIPESKHVKAWEILRYFMFFFLLGYVAAALCLLYGLEDLIYALTGVMFFFGAVFVFIVVVKGTATIRDYKETLLSKEEKEVMLKEIHHRVKNNLQIISSLLRLQKQYVKEDQVSSLFDECHDRVVAMALIHEKLYESKDLARVDTKGYIELLAENLINSYGIQQNIKLEVQSSIKNMELDKLIPLGLMINEIMSNSLKYAFNGKEAGNIRIHLNQREQDNCSLEISDDGIGYSEELFEQESSTFGLELIHLLTEQLDGTIEKVKSAGTKYQISFQM
jgi:two-component sensor histidine kinase